MCARCTSATWCCGCCQPGWERRGLLTESGAVGSPAVPGWAALGRSRAWCAGLQCPLVRPSDAESRGLSQHLAAGEGRKPSTKSSSGLLQLCFDQQFIWLCGTVQIEGRPLGFYSLKCALCSARILASVGKWTFTVSVGVMPTGPVMERGSQVC